MSSLMKSFMLTAGVAAAGYLWRNRNSLPSLRSLRSSAGTTPDRGVTIYDNHPTAE